MPKDSDLPDGRSLSVGRWSRRLLLRLPSRRRQAHAGPTAGDEQYLQRIHDFLHLLNGEWDWDVFVALQDGPLLYTELLHAVRAQTPASNWPGRTHQYLQEGTLSRTLLRLTQGELIQRERATCFPFTATYQLAPPARELLTVMAPAAAWTEIHSGLLVRAQQRRHGELDL